MTAAMSAASTSSSSSLQVPAGHFPRGAGVLLHPTSLPGRHGIGDLGAGARSFVDWLKDARCTAWQILPLVPPGAGYSPYASQSALAGNALLLDLDALGARGLLSEQERQAPASVSQDQVHWEAVTAFKQQRVQLACERLRHTDDGKAILASFRAANSWADDDALYVALKEVHHQAAWWTWPALLKNRNDAALDEARITHAPAIERRILEQALFLEQWLALKAYANNAGVRIIGDVPIYVADDSVDVWANREFFQLNNDGTPTHVAGCPPDAFAETGQWWGSPLYNWDALKADGHAWWIRRLKKNLELCDVVRIDHFRGFAGYWSIPVTAKDARGGSWKRGPGRALFDDLQAALAVDGAPLPIIAEDLGVITDDVKALRDGVGLPGMKVLQFAFGAGHDNEYLPHHHVADSVVYTGTHDNDTTQGWWRAEGEHTRDHVRRYISRDGSDIVWDMIRLAMMSVAHTAVVPYQDILTLDSGARMNVPGKEHGNWAWRVRADAFHPNLSQRLRELVVLSDRAPIGAEALAARTRKKAELEASVIPLDER